MTTKVRKRMNRIIDSRSSGTQRGKDLSSKSPNRVMERRKMAAVSRCTGDVDPLEDVLPLHCNVNATQDGISTSVSTTSAATGPIGVRTNAYSMGVDNLPPSSSSTTNGDIDKYADFPLVRSMITTEARRKRALLKDGAKQIKYLKSNSGFFRTIFLLEGRALDQIIVPWTLVTLWAVIWAIVYESTFRQQILPGEDVSMSQEREDNIEHTLQLVLNTTLGFLLIFRLNRSAIRFWMARENWGLIIAKTRTMTSSILLHGSHDAYNRDQAIKWIAAFSISCMNYLRGISKVVDTDIVAGILNIKDLEEVTSSLHPPLHVAGKIRYHIGELLLPTECDDDDEKLTLGVSPSQLKHSRSLVLLEFRANLLISLEEELNTLIQEMGSMERIKGTPLPLVYVSHLRTWLMVFLMSMPYIWEETLGYVTIPVVASVAFALLGLEGAAAEAEAPFRKDRTNHLDMSSYCLIALSGVMQQIREDADRRIHQSKRKGK